MALTGIDRAIFHSLIIKAFGVIRVPITTYLVIKCLTPAEQGYWYTFLSLGALTVFAEMGFLNIVTQFVSHEFAYLKENTDGTIYGPDKKIERFFSFIRFAFKFYAFIIPIAFFLLTFAGSTFLKQSGGSSLIILTWGIYSFTGAITLFVSLCSSILNGCNKIAAVQKSMLLNLLISNLGLWAALLLGLKLAGLWISTFLTVILGIILFYRITPKLWKQIFSATSIKAYNWFPETLPLQWRYALSWIAGYFVFQFITPLTMHYAGAESAGRMGLSISLVWSVMMAANVWPNTKLPLFNMYVAKNERKNLDKLFNITLKQSILMYCIGSILLLFICTYIFPLFQWDKRILSPFEIFLLIIAAFVTLIVQNWAVYLRAHKQEPYVWLSVAGGFFICTAFWLSMKIFASTTAAIMAYCIVNLILIIPDGLVFILKRREYSK